MSDSSAAQVRETTELSTGNESLFSGLPQELMERLTPAKNRAIMLWLTGQYSKTKIAKIIGVSDNTVSAWMMEPAVQLAIEELQKREFAVVESQLKALSIKALATMDELLSSNMDNVRFQAAKDLLDRSGHKPQQSIKVDKTITTVEQQLASLAEFTISDSDIIDIDISDVVDEVKGSGR